MAKVEETEKKDLKQEKSEKKVLTLKRKKLKKIF